MLLLAVVVVGAAACGSSNDAAGSKPAPKPNVCPKTWAASWQTWADRVGMTIYCPGWLPSPIDGVIHGQWNTARVPDKQWQLGFAWLENGDLVHIVFEGYPPGTFPPMCEGQPCFGGREPKTEDIAGHTVTWYDHNLASHTGHIAAVFHSLGNIYVISIHVAVPVSTPAVAKSDLRHVIRSLAPVKPRT
jgi:hypothetical protein